MAKEIICNRCGKKFDIWDAQEDFTIQTQMGYGTKFDGDSLEIHLCCSCMEMLIDGCIISPIKSDT